MPGQLEMIEGAWMSAVGWMQSSRAAVVFVSHGKSASTTIVDPLPPLSTHCDLGTSQLPGYAHAFGQSTLGLIPTVMPPVAPVYMVSCTTN